MKASKDALPKEITGKLKKLEKDLSKKTTELEIKNKDLKIEASLERVRTVSMSIKKPEDLLNICEVLFKELLILGFRELRNSMVNIFDDDNETFLNYDYSDEMGGSVTQMAYDINPVIRKQVMNARKKHNTYSDSFFSIDDLKDWKKFRKNYGEKDDPRLNKAKELHYYFYSVGTAAIGISCFEKISKDQKSILKRFRNVFDLAYGKYSDVTLAETQAREAQIELALERVRARTLAMQSSSELQDAAILLFEQIRKLGVNTGSCGFVIWENEKKDATFRMSSQDGSFQAPFTMPHTKTFIYKKIYSAKESGKDFFELKVSGERLKKNFDYLTTVPGIGEKIKGLRKARFKFPETMVYNCAFFKQGYLSFHTHESYPEAHEIFKRFAKVFEQTYTRFLDLQKAEAQTREAQIEAALERVWAKTMAMQHSEELIDAGGALYRELTNLGITSLTIGYVLMDKDEKIGWNYTANPSDGTIWNVAVGIPHDQTDNMRAVTKSWKKQEPYHVIEMNAVQTIKHQTFIAENSINFPYTTEELITFSPEKITLYSFNFKQGYLLIVGDKKLQPEQEEMLVRFTKVFQQTYQRFLDLQKAEAQAKEAQIEAALERVRSRSMGMQKSEELKEVIQVVYEQFVQLNIDVEHTGFIMDYKANEDMNIWLADQNGAPSHVTIPYFDSPHWNSFVEAKEKGIDFFANHLNFKEKNRFYKRLFKLIPGVPDDTVKFYLSCPGLSISTVLLDNVGLYIENFSGTPYSDEENKTLMRFGKVFQQTYTRFLDLQKSEEQARESQIELGLERVRARAMAMRKTDELLSAAELVYKELSSLGITSMNVSYAFIDDEEKNVSYYGINPVDGKMLPFPSIFPHSETEVMRSILSSWKRQDPVNLIELDEANTLKHQTYIGGHIQKLITKNNLDIPFTIKAFLEVSPKTAVIYTFNYTKGYLFVIGEEQLTKMQEDIVLRFTKVFDMTYRRFLDLTQAEAQAREAQIEAALERVRSKTMAMHDSKDVGVTVVTLFDEVLKLGLDKSIRCGIGILEGNERMETWSATSYPDGKVDLKMGMLDMTIHPMLIGLKKAWENGKSNYSYDYIGDDVIRYYKALNKEPDYPFSVEIDSLPENEYHRSFFFKEGILFAFAPNPISEEAANVLNRFAGVFGQTYRRFRDLQIAEAQAREAQIEAALERVRSQTMSMNKSQDLEQVVAVIFKELDDLDLKTLRCGIGIINGEKRSVNVWTTTKTNEGLNVNFSGNESMDVHPLLQGAFEHWQKQEDYFYKLEGKDLKKYYKTINDENYKLPVSAEGTDVSSINCQYYYCTYFSAGGLFFLSESSFTENLIKVIKRFANAFSLAYKRFEDLKQSEARALEAIKESSLDRVRAEIASMRSTEDLNRITPLIWRELTTLEVPFFRCGVFIIDEINKQVQVHLSAPDGHSLAAMELPFNANELTESSVDHWRKGLVYTEHWNKDEFINWTQTMMEQGKISDKVTYQDSSVPPESLDLHFIPFTQGMIYVGNNTPLSNDKIDMIKSLADAFSIAYSRYEDFNNLEKAKQSIETTLTELKATQSQLIQSEKMASLGELTAGIAHEIQNPLNFVNNFSEVNTELIDELNEELSKGNFEDAKDLARDIKDNEEKIKHHGKRAEAIVKGMLQHSRTSSGLKEPANINTLADEYLRLAYHGLRAKDKTFNAKLETDYDESIGNVNIISQDIGRVILNLITNAFYVVDEKKKKQPEGYEPVVKVSTKKDDDKILISVKDNANGIPPHVLEKIFQPFFTTKPTGQGTGLGLSLSYDIIKAHHGELKVVTKEGEGSEFVIMLPVD